jgi:hypothetical protein
MATEIPIACTLSATDYRARLAEIAALSRDALRHVERRGLTLDLRYAPEAAARVRQLVEQERTCCAFLQFDLHESADEVQSTAAGTSPRGPSDSMQVERTPIKDKYPGFFGQLQDSPSRRFLE